MRVLLVHGLGRTPLSLVWLARDLRRAGHQPVLIGYVAALESWATIRARVRSRLEQTARGGRSYAAVGHSLGGVLLRSALADWPSDLSPPRRVVMLGTPNHPPRLAARFRDVWPYGLLGGECGRLLAHPPFYESLPPPPVPYTVIAGTGGWKGRWSPFRGDPNDGLVAVSEAELGGPGAMIQLPVGHTFMTFDRRVRALVCDVLAAA
jgi:hypothetical protein